jgi:hypothetical protein
VPGHRGDGADAVGRVSYRSVPRCFTMASCARPARKVPLFSRSSPGRLGISSVATSATARRRSKTRDEQMKDRLPWPFVTLWRPTELSPLALVEVATCRSKTRERDIARWRRMSDSSPSQPHPSMRAWSRSSAKWPMDSERWPLLDARIPSMLRGCSRSSRWCSA